jgi:sterol 24-C-methyltransferase
MASPILTAAETTPVVNVNRQLQAYYASIESRVGYRLLLGGTRHFGYWPRDTYWPFPLSRGLRAMEDQLATALALPPGARVLDAGCGVGHVALHLAKNYGLQIKAIDIVDHHVEKARRNVAHADIPLPGSVSAERMDYHHLETLESASLDGVYTMETFVHATDPEAVLETFYRILRPGGHLAMHEYEHEVYDDSTGIVATGMRQVNQYSAMPTNAVSRPGVFKRMLEEAGFVDVVVRDYSENVKPMTRLFFLLAVVPYLFISMFGLERYFINTVAGFGSWYGKDSWRYRGISATKPGDTIENEKTK